MQLFNRFIPKAVSLADRLTRWRDPFDTFTRPFMPPPKETLSLEDKEQFFSSQIQTEFLLPNGVFNLHKVYPPELLEIGDQALFHGVYIAMLAMKYHVTQDAQVMDQLYHALVAHKNHWEKGLLLRGIDPSTGDFRDDPSNDTLTGVLWGNYCAYKWGADLSKKMAQTNLFRLAGELIDYSYNLVDQKGTPTPYGRLEQGVLVDPLRITLCLAVLKAAVYAGDFMYETHYQDLLKKYRFLIPYGKVQLIWMGKDYDTWRAAVHLRMLLELDPSLTPEILVGFSRIWKLTYKSMNPFLMLLLGHPSSPMRIMDRLNEFSIKTRGLQIETINRHNLNWNAAGIRFILWTNEWRASQPLPFWAMPGQDFFWQRNLNAVDGWTGATDTHLRFSGLDFLVAYWLAHVIVPTF